MDKNKEKDILRSIEHFADNAHDLQTRKYTPERYIVHPVRVMKLCNEYTDDVAILAAALLHDVLEDTPVTEDEIRMFLRNLLNDKDVERTIQYVIELTDVYVKAAYPHWNRRTRKAKEFERLLKISADAQTIKYADVIDNSVEIVRHDKDFARVLLYEYRTMLKSLNKGNADLYNKAVDTVATGIKAL